MTIRRTDDANICYMTAEPDAFWCYGIVEWRIDTRDKKFIMTPILRDKSEGPVVDASEAWEWFLRERHDG